MPDKGKKAGRIGRKASTNLYNNNGMPKKGFAFTKEIGPAPVYKSGYEVGQMTQKKQGGMIPSKAEIAKMGKVVRGTPKGY